ncbi:Hypothetical protein PHPALM_11297 [Phytophthora palmivora]|uniref:Uncharacterized protein n=1 Tax=Phytophthora palmivora TaxID=4796 RepID=A0A2P4Y2J8_9STRA|nr:Hypothetical protein PHPALM_11297 [Phytophthora palmivora]
MFFSFLFREITPGYVDVMGRGIFDLAGGELLKLVLPHATTSVMDGLLRERRQFKALTKKSVCSMCIRKKKSALSGTSECLSAPNIQVVK